MAWHPLGISRDSLRHPSKSIGEPISEQELEESSKHPISSREESWFPEFYWRGRPTFHKKIKRSLPSAIGMWEGPWICCLQWSGYLDALTQKKVVFPFSGLNPGSALISKNKGMSESPVETVDKALGPRFIWTGVSHHLTPQEAHRVQCFKRLRCLTIL